MKKNFSRRDISKAAYTLTEIALVLGILGLVLGAIWVAASTIYNSRRVSTAIIELMNIKQNMQTLYATSLAVDVGANMGTLPFTGISAGASTTYAQVNVLPANTITQPSSTTYTITNPWGGSINIMATSNGSLANNSFVVDFDRVPISACITMISEVAGAKIDSQLWRVQIAASGSLAMTDLPSYTQGVFPITPAMADNNLNGTSVGCSIGNPYLNVGFMYTLR